MAQSQPLVSQRAIDAAQWLTLQQAAQHLNITERSVRRMIAEGRLPAHRLGNKLIRISAADLDALLTPIPAAGA